MTKKGPIRWWRVRVNDKKGVPTWVNCRQVAAIYSGCISDQGAHSLRTWTPALWNDTCRVDTTGTNNPWPMCPWTSHTDPNPIPFPSLPTQEEEGDEEQRRWAHSHRKNGASPFSEFLFLSKQSVERKRELVIMVMGKWLRRKFSLSLSLVNCDF